MSKSPDVLADLARVGAILTGRHFVYTSGKHGPNYINIDPLFPDATLTFEICQRLAHPFKGEFDTVASPAVGGVVLCELTALAESSKQRPVHAVWADKTADGFEFERAGFVEHLRGRRVLLVEDLLTTGGSLSSVHQKVLHHGGLVVGASVICNRGRVTARELGLERLAALADVDFEAYDAEECPMCARSEPIVEDIGHGAEYKVGSPGYSGGYIRLLRNS